MCFDLSAHSWYWIPPPPPPPAPRPLPQFKSMQWSQECLISSNLIYLRFSFFFQSLTPSNITPTPWLGQVRTWRQWQTADVEQWEECFCCGAHKDVSHIATSPWGRDFLGLECTSIIPSRHAITHSFVCSRTSTPGTGRDEEGVHVVCVCACVWYMCVRTCGICVCVHVVYVCAYVSVCRCFTSVEDSLTVVAHVILPGKTHTLLAQALLVRRGCVEGKGWDVHA